MYSCRLFFANYQPVAPVGKESLHLYWTRQADTPIERLWIQLNSTAVTEDHGTSQVGLDHKHCSPVLYAILPNLEHFQLKSVPPRHAFPWKDAYFEHDCAQAVERECTAVQHAIDASTGKSSVETGFC